MSACMIPIRSPRRKKLAFLFLLVVLFTFWGLSRYPDLMAEYNRTNDHSLLSRNVGVLSKDAMLQVHGLQSPVTKIWNATLNWLDTNKIGMSFGFIFSAAILLLLEQSQFLYRRAKKKGVIGSLSGILLGMPLGVCTNCATPVALGLKKSGASDVSAFSTLVASPSLNPIGLTMIFMLFPPLVGGLRVTSLLFFLVLVMPLLTRLLSHHESTLIQAGPSEDEKVLQESWKNSFSYCLKRYWFYLSYIIKAVLPLMVLIGIVAAVLVTYLPLEGFLLGANDSISSIVFAGLFATLLPMPMFVDIIIVWMFYSMGLSTALATTLLITLPSTSLFATIVMARQVSWRLSLVVMSSIALLGITCGIAVHQDEVSKEKANTTYERVQGFVPIHTERAVAAYNNESLKDFIGSGVSMVDIDADGDLDIFLASPNGARLLQNDGKGHFTNITNATSIDGSLNTMAGIWGDINNDGLPDLFMVNYKDKNGEGQQNRLYLNLGEGQFKDVTEQYGLNEKELSASAAFADFDNDGDLDLFVSNYGSLTVVDGKSISGQSVKDRLYRNDGGQFVEIAEKAGVSGQASQSDLIRDIEANSKKGDRGFSFQPVWFDYDNDGLIDLYVSADFGTGQLYRNLGDGTFSNETVTAGLDVFGTGMGVEVLDINQDGNFDLLVTTGLENQLWINDGKGKFKDKAEAFGVADNQRFGWGVAAFDFDNSGFTSLLIANGVTMNYAGLSQQLSTMAKVSNINMFFVPKHGGGFANYNKKYRLYNDKLSRGLAVGDLNNDGRVDVAIANRDTNEALVVYENRNQAAERSLSIRLEGSDEVNRMAIGTKVSVIINGKVQNKLVMAGSSYMSQHSPRLHFGLGKQAVADKVVVTWPNGKTTTITKVKAGTLTVKYRQP